MVFEHHDFEALQCWNGSHSNWSMNISDGERERESGLQLFVDGLSFQLYFFPFMFLFFPLWSLFRPKMVTHTRIIKRCNKKCEPASGLTHFFPPSSIWHWGLWQCGRVSKLAVLISVFFFAGNNLQFWDIPWSCKVMLQDHVAANSIWKVEAAFFWVLPGIFLPLLKGRQWGRMFFFCVLSWMPLASCTINNNCSRWIIWLEKIERTSPICKKFLTSPGGFETVLENLTFVTAWKSCLYFRFKPALFSRICRRDALSWFLCCTGHGEIPHPHRCIMFENMRFYFWETNLDSWCRFRRFLNDVGMLPKKSMRRPEHHQISSWSFFSSAEISSVQLLGPFCWVLHWTLQQESPRYNWFRNSCHQLRYMKPAELGRFSISTVSQDFSFYQQDQKPTPRKKPALQLIRWLTIQSFSSADCAFFSFPCDPKLFRHQSNRWTQRRGLGLTLALGEDVRKAFCGFSGAKCRNRWKPQRHLSKGNFPTRAYPPGN